IVTTNVNEVCEVRDGIVHVKDTAELSPEALVAVAGYETNEKGYVTVTLHDKIRALDLLGKVLGMKRSVNAEGPNVAVQVNVNNAVDAGSRVMARFDAVLARQPALPTVLLAVSSRRP